MTKNKSASPLLVILAFLSIYVIWGSTYFFIQKAVHGFPPFMLGAIRFTIAGLLLMTWCAIKGEKIFIKRDIFNSAISGILLLFIGNGIVIWVEQVLPSAMVAIMVSSAPIWFVLLDKSKWVENFKTKIVFAGLILGFGGVLLLFGEQVMGMFSASNKSSPNLSGLVLLVIGPIAWAAGSLYSKYNSTTGSASVNTAWQMIIAGLAFVAGTLLLHENENLNWKNIPTESWAALIYLIIMGSIVAFSAYVWLLQVRSATQVSTYAYVNPVVALLLGIFFANENVSGLQIFGLIIILGSVMLINFSKYRNTTIEKSA